MRTYNVTEFRENLASALDQAATETILITRNGRSYELREVPASKGSGLDVGFVQTKNPVTRESILEDIAKSRERV